uniref:EOG090X0431 n=1 Tax=Ceriodaphnia reticulata TaxID=302197 RepID=A0A4Y7LZI8_9CRUS|nr:EOG090X0431 [Ceriodaphnia reticulata]SVE72859.1 EOG090X0431 [Ceriodaphnia reticulata]
MNSYSSLVSLNPFLTSSNVRNFVRNRLNQHLIGIMNDDVRKKLVSVAFAIRHLPSLRRIDHSSSSVSSAVKLLNQNSKEIYEEADNLSKLKELSLPSGMLNSKDERELSYELMDYFNKGPLKIRLKFELRQSSSDCLYQAQSCPYETSEEELSSDSEESSQRNRRTDDIDYNGDHDWVEDVDVFDDQSVDDFYDEDEDFDGDSFDEDDCSGNAAAPPPLPSLPPPPPPPPPPPVLTAQFEPPPPGSGAIKFTIPSKGNNKLQKMKQEKTPSTIQVPQYPSATGSQVASISSQQTVENKPPEPTYTQAKSSGMPVDWPDSLRCYVERCFAMCKSSVDKDFVELILKGKITSASREGKALTKDWDSEPLPNLSRLENNAPKPAGGGIPSGLKAGTSGFSVSPLKPGTTTVLGSPGFRMSSIGQDISPFKSATSNAGISPFKPVTNDAPSFQNGTATNPSNTPFKTGTSALGISALKTSAGAKPNQISFQLKGQRKAINAGTLRKSSSSSSSSSSRSRSRSPVAGLGLGSINRTVLGANWTSPDKLRKRQARFQMPKKTRLAALGDCSLYREDITGDEDWSNLLIVGTCCEVEKPFFRLTAAPDPSTVRPVPILKKALYRVKSSWIANPDYRSCCDQMKSIRQDLTVQGIRDSFTVEVYETHARLALEAADHEEFNQCQTQLKALHHEVGGKNILEFTAYRILYYIFTKSTMDLTTTMASLTREDKANECVAHALEVRSSWALANFRRFFRLYNKAPRMSAHLITWFADRERKVALKTLIKAYRPHIPVELVTTQLGFPTLDAWHDFSKELPIVYSDDSKAQIDCKASTVNLTAW